MESIKNTEKELERDVKKAKEKSNGNRYQGDDQPKNPKEPKDKETVKDGQRLNDHEEKDLQDS